MTLNTSSANSAFLASAVGDLIVQPVQRESLALSLGTVIQAGTANSFRVPIVTADASAAWVAEGGEIAASDANLGEVITDFYKLAGLQIITRELADDSNPAAAELVGAGLARDIARQIDSAFFGTNATETGPTPARNEAQPRGLEDLAGVSPVDAGVAWKNGDPFTEAHYGAESVGATLTAFVANPADALQIAQLKESSASNRDLLQPDPTASGVRLIAGVPLHVSSAVTVGTIWGIPQQHTLVALRDDVDMQIDSSAFFTTDRVAVRATMRLGWVFPHAAAVQKISLTAGD